MEHFCSQGTKFCIRNKILDKKEQIEYKKWNKNIGIVEQKKEQG
jgi:hypothetical protein